MTHWGLNICHLKEYDAKLFWKKSLGSEFFCIIVIIIDKNTAAIISVSFILIYDYFIIFQEDKGGKIWTYAKNNAG